MSISRAPYIGSILRAKPSDITSSEQTYELLLDVACDITTVLEKKSELYRYSHEVWIWNNNAVMVNGDSVPLSEYKESYGAIVIEEGLYFKSTFMGKTISGEIKLYNPSQFGIMLGIDTNII